MNEQKFRQILEAFERVAEYQYKRGYRQGQAKLPKDDPKSLKLNVFAKQKLRLFLFSK